MMSYYVNEVKWNTDKNTLVQIREKVFVYELHIPKKVEFDQHDKYAHHVLVTDKRETPIATGRLCQNGLLGRIAVLPAYRNRLVYKTLLNHLVNIADNKGMQVISINCILEEVDLFKQNGFNVNGNVFMEAGIARQKMQCPISQFDTRPFTLVH
jgi:predicted GNAT family N-acyltransferase